MSSYTRLFSLINSIIELQKHYRKEVLHMLLTASFSTGKEAYAHDIRESIKHNVNTGLSKDNIIFRDVLQGKSIESYIDKMMEQTIEKYNEKQTREDRKIKSGYCEWHMNNKTLRQSKLVYEAVAQIGSHDDLGKMYYEAQGEKREKMHRYFEAMYKKVLEDFEQKYPHLKVMWCTVHFDEEQGTPHMHLAFTPIGTFEKQGLAQKVSIGRALEQDGIKRVKDRAEAKKLGGYQLTKLYREIKQSIEQELTRQGHTIKPEQHGKKHQTVEEWEAIQALQQERAAAQKQADKAIKEAKAYMDYTEELKQIHEAAHRPPSNSLEVQRVQVKDGFRKTKEMVQLTPENFESYKSSSDTKAIERTVEMKIQQQQQANQKLVQSLATDREAELQEQVQQLQLQLKEAKEIIERYRENFKKAKQFLQELKLYDRFMRWLGKTDGTEERVIEKEDDFVFEGEFKDEQERGN